ncbi:MAG: phage tail length tape measure family protein [Nitratireductor sp.]
MFSGFSRGGQSAEVLKLNNFQLANMQFQMQDLGVQLASGQSPFMAIIQQGSQIAGIFGPGATVSQALKATGAGIMSFLTSPINLAVIGFAAAAAAVPLIWEAFTGPEAKSAGTALDDFNKQLEDLEKIAPETGAALRAMLKEIAGFDEISVALDQSAETLRAGYDVALSDIADKVAPIQKEIDALDKASRSAGASIAAMIQGRFSEGERELAQLTAKLQDGSMTAREFSAEMRNIILAQNTPDDVRALARELLKASSQAEDLKRAMEGVTTESARMAERIKAGFSNVELTADLAFRMNPDSLENLQSELQRQRDAINATARDGERAAQEAAQRAEQRASNKQVLADLQSEVAALNQTGAAREQALAQLREEHEIRQMIASFGPEISAADITAIQTYIPLKNAAIEASREHEQQMRAEQQQAAQLGSAFASITQQLIAGTDAGKVFGQVLLQLGSQLLNSGFTSLFGGNGGNPLGFLGSLFGGGSSSLGLPFNLLGRHDEGTSFIVGGSGGTDTNTVMFRATKGERVDVTPAAQVGMTGKGQSGPSKLDVNVNVSGARGNSEIEEMVRRGVSAGLASYDADVLPSRVGQINNDPRGR